MIILRNDIEAMSSWSHALLFHKLSFGLKLLSYEYMSAFIFWYMCEYITLPSAVLVLRCNHQFLCRYFIISILQFPWRTCVTYLLCLANLKMIYGERGKWPPKHYSLTFFINIFRKYSSQTNICKLFRKYQILLCNLYTVIKAIKIILESISAFLHFNYRILLQSITYSKHTFCGAKWCDMHELINFIILTLCSNCWTELR